MTDRTIVQCRVELALVTPTVWRRLLVPGDAQMVRLHSILQVAFGWSDAHLHEFRIGDRCYGPADDDGDLDEDQIDEVGITVVTALGLERAFIYLYDFGDEWLHRIEVEEVAIEPLGLKVAVCLGGENASPPEDIGGVPGYQAFLEAVGDPSHDEHEDYLNWVGGSFDPAAFDLGLTNAKLQRLR